MTDGDALLKAIYANPRDDTPRLIYADWLDENAGIVPCKQCETVRESSYGRARGLTGCTDCSHCGGSGQLPGPDAARAAFIRDCPRLRHYRVTRGRWAWGAWCLDRWGESATEPPTLWHAGIPHRFRPTAMKLVPIRLREELHSYTTRRGFVDTITVPPEVWAVGRLRRRLAGEFPLTGVAFTRPGRVLFGDRVGMTTKARLPWNTEWRTVPVGRPGGRRCPWLALCRIEWPGIDFDYAPGG